MPDPNNGTGDPRLDMMLKAAPEQNPSDLYPLLHGQRTQDIPLEPKQSLLQVLMSRLGLNLPTTGGGLTDMFANRDQRMMDAKPKQGTYPIAIPQHLAIRSDDIPR